MEIIFLLIIFLQEFHTHPNGELGATQSAPAISDDVKGLQSDKPKIPNASFIILYRIQARKSQENTIILMNIDHKKDNEMKKLLIILIVLSVSTCSLYSQNKTIKGRVIDNNWKLCHTYQL